METPVTALTPDPRTRGQDKDGASPRRLQITNRVSGQRCGASSPSGPGASTVLRPLALVCWAGLTGCTGRPKSQHTPLPLDVRTRHPSS